MEENYGSPFSECAPATKPASAHRYRQGLPEGWVVGHQPSSHAVVDTASVSQGPSLNIKEKMMRKLEMTVDEKGATY